ATAPTCWTNWTTCCGPGTPTPAPPRWSPTRPVPAGWGWTCADTTGSTTAMKSWNSSRGCGSTGAPPGSMKPAGSRGWRGFGCMWMGMWNKIPGADSAPWAVCSSRFDGDLQHAVALVGKQIVGRDDVIQFVVVGDQHAQIQPLGGNHVHQAAHALLAAGAQGGADTVIAQAGGKGIERNFKILRIHAQAGQRPAWLEAAQRLLERGLRT